MSDRVLRTVRREIVLAVLLVFDEETVGMGRSG